MGEMRGKAIEPVGNGRAGRAARLVIGPEHEMVDEKLRAAAEEIGERGAALVSVETIGLVDTHPGQFLAPARQFVALLGQRLFVFQQGDAGLKPRLARTGLVCGHRSLSCDCRPAFAKLSRTIDGLAMEREISAPSRMARVTSLAGFEWIR